MNKSEASSLEAKPFNFNLYRSNEIYLYNTPSKKNPTKTSLFWCLSKIES